ncbi:hypothetical protein LUZ60_006211 [Juncus effusus]|nr:hypothetical protein LUZ60_006211 [Juncus effusus]
MDDDGGMRNWGSFYENPLKGNLGLQLMPSVNDRETKPYFFFSNGTATFNPEPSVPTMGFMRDSWMYHHRDTTTSHPAPNPNPNSSTHNPNPNHHNHNPNLHHQHQQVQHHHHQNLTKIPQYYEQLQEPAMATNLQMINPDERVSVSVPVPVPVPENQSNNNNNNALNEEAETPKKKKKKKKPSSQLDQTEKPQPKPKKAKKEPSSSDGPKKERTNNKDVELERIIINGLEIDLSKIPTPVCSCTGGPQQCYRWGIGGWQSACCTNTISVYPLPLSDKRRGARIAGRKMSIGAFRKVLERVVAEGVDLSEPIDLKGFWAKHGTNKFVTIR